MLGIVNEVTLARRLGKKGWKVVCQVSIPIEFEGEKFDEGFPADLIFEGRVILELKSMEKTSPGHTRRLPTCLKLTVLKLGLPLNQGEELMNYGITRTINGQFDG